MNLLVASGSILAGLILLMGGGDMLVRGAVRLAERMRVSPAMVGTVIVGFGTSVPELAAAVDAALSGAAPIAWGNVAGSNIANSLFILGTAALFFPIATSDFSAWRDPLIGLGAALVLLACAVFNWQTMWAGLALIAMVIAYVAWCYSLETRGAVAAMTSGAHSRAEALEMADKRIHAPLDGYGKPLLFLLAGLVLLVIGARMLIAGASELALAAGLSQTVVGLTVVAIGTSLPELVTSVVAAKRGQGGIALGNILGSNIYNILGIGGAALLLAPHSIPGEFAGFEFPLVVFLAALLFLFVLLRITISRLLGVILLAAYIGYIAQALLPQS